MTKHTFEKVCLRVLYDGKNYSNSGITNEDKLTYNPFQAPDNQILLSLKI